MTLSDLFVEMELARIDWSHVREADGPATSIPSALRELINSPTAAEVEVAYWKLENHVVLQGQMFEASLFVIPVIMAAFVGSDRPNYVKNGLLELLFQILHAVPHVEEEDRGIKSLDELCRRSAREGIWLLYRECFGDASRVAREVVQLLEPDGLRLHLLDKMMT